MWTQIHTRPKLGEIPFTRIRDIVFTTFSDHCLLWLWRLTFRFQNLTSTSTNPNTSVTKSGWNSFHWFLRYGVHKVFKTHRLTLTDGQTRLQNASVTVVTVTKTPKRKTTCNIMHNHVHYCAIHCIIYTEMHNKAHASECHAMHTHRLLLLRFKVTDTKVRISLPPSSWDRQFCVV